MLERELKALAHSGARVLRFTGGEPALDPRLPALVARAIELGIERVEIETNGRTLSQKTARAWRQAGASRVWLYWLPAESADAISGVPGTSEIQERALRHAHAGGLAVGLNVPVTTQMAPLMDSALQRAIALAPVDYLRLHVVAEVWAAASSAPLESELRAVVRTARRGHVAVEFEADRCPPLCWFSPEFVGRHALLFRSAARGVARPGRVGPCQVCSAEDVCARPLTLDDGPPDAAAAPPTPAGRSAETGGFVRTPWTEATLVDPLRRGLGGYGRHLRSRTSELTTAEGAAQQDEAVLRVIWACNERCRFCWVDFDWTAPTFEALCGEVAALYDKGHRRLSLSGGEPTLASWLPALVEHAKDTGFDSVELQTNAMILGEADRANQLARAGLDAALVSLHAANAEISDRITQRPGGFARTVAGIDALLRAAVRVCLSTVITGMNVTRMVEFVDFIADRWGGDTPIAWALAHPITRAASVHADSIAPLDLAGPALLAALERSDARGVGYSNVNEPCGAPPCALQFSARYARRLPAEQARHPAFTHPPTCSACAARPHCRGVRAAYVDLFGERGLRAATPSEAEDLPFCQ